VLKYNSRKVDNSANDCNCRFQNRDGHKEEKLRSATLRGIMRMCHKNQNLQYLIRELITLLNLLFCN